MVNPRTVLLASAATASAGTAPCRPTSLLGDSSLPTAVAPRKELGARTPLTPSLRDRADGRPVWTRVPRGGDPYAKDFGGSSDETESNSNSNDRDDASQSSSSHKNRRRRSSSKKPFANGKNNRNRRRRNAADVDSAGSQPSAPSEPSSSEPPNPVVEEIRKADNFYDVLGVSKSATANDIKKAYRKRCVHTHPDKPGGDRKAFDKVTEAYEVLSDESKRSLYNRYGKSAVDPTNSMNGAAGSNAYQDIFQSMFRQQQQQQQRPRRNPTMRYQLEVSLEDLYFGKTEQVSIGIPSGRSFAPAASKTVEITIPKGAVNGQKIRLSGEVDFSQDSHPGDLVFTLVERSHPVFTRKGHDLAIKVHISLYEALNGVKKTIRHIDGSSLTLVSARQDGNTSTSSGITSRGNNSAAAETDKQAPPIPISNGDVHVLPGYGMPKRNMLHEYGDLYVQYHVSLPKFSSGASRLTDDERKELVRLLAKLEGKSDPAQQRQASSSNERRTKVMQKASVSDFGRKSGRVQLDNDDLDGDDDYMMGDGANPFGDFFPGGNGRSFFFSQSFGGRQSGAGDDGNVECNQM